MTTEYFYALLPDHVVLALVLGLMVLEMLRLDVRWARAAFVLAMAAGLAAVLQQISTGYTLDIFPGEVHLDHLALVGKLIVLACGLGVALGFAGAATFKFWLLLAASLQGALLIMGSSGFATLFLGIEMLSLPAFALMVHQRGQSPAGEAAFKYLLMSSVGTALLLFGISLAYGVTGEISIASFAVAFGAGGGAVKAAGLLVLAGLFLKSAVFPFHAWAPDAYAGAPLRVTAILASVVKAAVVLALLRVVGPVPLDGASVALIGVLAIVSIGFGNLAALPQRRFKRLLAYSSVAHAGYMIFALVDTTGSRVDDLMWYVAIYALATLLACAAFAAISPEDDELAVLDGQFAAHPVASVLLALAVLSLAGMPPLPGFFAKLFVFKSVVASGHLVAATIAFAGSFLGLAYYLGIVLRLFRTGAEPVTGEHTA